MGIKLSQRLHQKVVHGHPNGATPVGISAKKPRRRFARLVGEAVVAAFDLDVIASFVFFGNATNAALAQKLIFVEHGLQQAV